jgi:hypothetical protein
LVPSGRHRGELLTLQGRDVVAVDLNDTPAGIAKDQQVDISRRASQNCSDGGKRITLNRIVHKDESFSLRVLLSRFNESSPCFSSFVVHFLCFVVGLEHRICLTGYV